MRLHRPSGDDAVIAVLSALATPLLLWVGIQWYLLPLYPVLFLTFSCVSVNAPRRGTKRSA